MNDNDRAIRRFERQWEHRNLDCPRNCDCDDCCGVPARSPAHATGPHALHLACKCSHCATGVADFTAAYAECGDVAEACDAVWGRQIRGADDLAATLPVVGQTATLPGGVVRENGAGTPSNNQEKPQ